MRARGTINCGTCGFKIQVEAESQDRQKVILNISSDCPQYQKIAAELQEVDAFREVFQPLHMGQVYQVFAKHSSHPSCPGISGILKTIEVAAGLSLAHTATIEIAK